MKLIITSFILLAMTACSQQESSYLWQAKDMTGNSTILVAGLKNSQALKAQAQKLGLKTKGKAVLQISGPKDLLAELKIHKSEKPSVITNQSIEIVRNKPTAKPDEQIYYLAKKSFGLPEFLKKNPTYDGRGVVAGVIDDGVSPISSGMQVTTDGKRKYINKKTTSSLLKVKLDKPKEDFDNSILLSLEQEYSELYVSSIDESTLSKKSTDGRPLDLNSNGKMDDYLTILFLKTPQGHRVCIDSDASKIIKPTECFGLFKETGEYGFWDEKKLYSIQASYDSESQSLNLTQGERRDSHGEGVASVLLGHKIAGRFDGVAPGAQLVDYDFTESHSDFEEDSYSIGHFVEAIEWLGQQGVEVANISYSLFFVSSKSQEFMQKAIKAVVDKYNMVVSFSAGNNGPGLGSLNRRSIYPDNVLVAGAYVSPKLYEYVHGVTGLPKQGRVVSYSSRGPGPGYGHGPVVISPLSSLTHSTPQGGYMAFSGTSSAAPALAGFAAVLISAVKQEGMTVDASAIVHAIRLSAKPIRGASFLDQGYGLPKIARALKHYRSLIQGENFAFVKTKLQKINNTTEVDAEGILIKTSQWNQTEFRLRLKAHLADKVPAAQGAELLKTVDVKYSHPWIMGPEKSWLSVGTSSLFVSIDKQQVLKKIQPGGELTAEIKLYDPTLKQSLHIIPVTIINDTLLDKELTRKYLLGAEQTARIHFRLPPGSQGYEISSDVETGLGAAVYVLPYNKSFVKGQGWGIRPDRRIFMATEADGYQQLTIIRSKGTMEKSKVKVALKPVNVSVVSEAISLSGSKLILDNKTDMGLDVELKMENRDQLLHKYYGELSSLAPWFGQRVHKLRPGRYNFLVKPAEVHDVTYPVVYCALELKEKSGALVKRFTISSSSWTPVGLNYEVKKEDADKNLDLKCSSFERVKNSIHRIGLVVEVHKKTDTQVYGTKKVRLQPGVNSVSLNLSSKGDEGARVRVYPFMENTPISLGEVDFY